MIKKLFKSHDKLNWKQIFFSIGVAAILATIIIDHILKLEPNFVNQVLWLIVYLSIYYTTGFILPKKKKNKPEIED